MGLGSQFRLRKMRPSAAWQSWSRPARVSARKLPGHVEERSEVGGAGISQVGGECRIGQSPRKLGGEAGMVGNIVEVGDRGSDPVVGLTPVLEVVVQDLVTLVSGQIGDVDDHPSPLQEGKGTWLEVGPGCAQDVVAGGENELAAAVDSRSDLRGHALPTVRQVRAELSGPKRIVKPEQLLSFARIPPVGELGSIFQSDYAGVEGVGRSQSQFAGESGLAGGRGGP